MSYLEKVLKRKEKYLEQNPQYRKHEDIYHRRIAGKYIGDFIYGANDGIITTFAVVAGATGATLSPSIVIILGFANLLADGISMGASNYLGGKSEQDYAKAQRAKEHWEVEHLREIEVEEIREIYEKKGFKGEDLARAVKIITTNKEVWVDTMMKEELGIITDDKNDPRKHGLVTFLAFVLAGLIPLLPYVVSMPYDKFLSSILLGAITLFVVGSSRSIITTVSWVRGGIEMLLIGSATAITAFGIGALIESLIR